MKIPPFLEYHYYWITVCTEYTSALYWSTAFFGQLPSTEILLYAKMLPFCWNTSISRLQILWSKLWRKNPVWDITLMDYHFYIFIDNGSITEEINHCKVKTFWRFSLKSIPKAFFGIYNSRQNMHNIFSEKSTLSWKYNEWFQSFNNHKLRSKLNHSSLIFLHIF